VTLIPPSSMDALCGVLCGQKEESLAEWLALAEKAKEQKQYMIHFGL